VPVAAAAAGVDTGAAVVTAGWGVRAGVAETGAGVAAGVWDCGAVEVQPARNAVASRSPHTIPIRIRLFLLDDGFIGIIPLNTTLLVMVT